MDIPWYVIPADDKRNASLIISATILDFFNGLELTYPTSDASRREELRLIRETLAENETSEMPGTSTRLKENS